MIYSHYRLASEDNSAIANLDYAPLFANNPITISPTDDPIKLVPVNIINDALFEEEENFRVRLSTTDPSVNILGVNPANVFITDDDGKIFTRFHMLFIAEKSSQTSNNLQTTKLYIFYKIAFENMGVNW